MALFLGQDDIRLATLTKIYQLDTNNVEELETFIEPDREKRETIHQLIEETVSTGDPWWKESVKQWDSEVTEFAKLCRFAKELMDSLYTSGPTIRQLRMLFDWQRRVTTVWMKHILPEIPAEEIDIDEPLAPDVLFCSEISSGIKNHQWIPHHVKKITASLNTLILAYSEGSLPEVLGQCQECQSLFIIHPNANARREYCSHRCRNRVRSRMLTQEKRAIRK